MSFSTRRRVAKWWIPLVAAACGARSEISTSRHVQAEPDGSARLEAGSLPDVAPVPDAAPHHGWSVVGGPAITHTSLTSPALAIDPAGAPLVAVNNLVGAGSVAYVERWDGVTWSQIGDPIKPAEYTIDCLPSLAIDPSGQPVAGLTTVDPDTANAFPFLAVRSGGTWALSMTDTIAVSQFCPGAIALDNTTGTTSVPVSRWSNGPSVLQASVATWAATVTASDLVAFSGRLPRASQLQIDAQGVASAAAIVLSPPVSIAIERWNGTAWQVTTDPFQPAGNYESFAFAISGTGTPYLAVGARIPPSADVDLSIHRWTGSAWETLGTFDVPPDHYLHVDSRPLLAVDSQGSPLVAVGALPRTNTTGSNYILVKKWDGASWNVLDAPIEPVGQGWDIDSFFFSFALAGDDTPFVGFAESNMTSADAIYVERYDP